MRRGVVERHDLGSAGHRGAVYRSVIARPARSLLTAGMPGSGMLCADFSQLCRAQRSEEVPLGTGLPQDQ
jgi:hypothetical protein